MKKLISLVLALTLALSLAACGGSGSSATTGGTQSQTQTNTDAAQSGSDAPAAEGVTYKIGICNYVDHASLNQIVDNVTATLGAVNGATFEIDYENCNADAAVMNQIIANFIADGVDLMVGVATPVAMAMQAATEDNGIPVVFAAVSDPLAVDLVASLDAPGANITGTSDYLNTNAILDLIFAANPDAAKVGLLYDVGQDASTGAINDAKAYLDAKGVPYVERTATTAAEVQLAAQALVGDGVDAVFTPTDNTIMESELAIYESFAEAGVPHYAGADSFALNGAFLGYGVDYANLGVETANTIVDILVNGADPASTPVKTFDNGIATVNTETCAVVGFTYDDIAAKFAPYCTQIVPIATAENF